MHDRRRYIGGLVLLARTDSTFARTTQLDNHLCVSSWPNASAATLARTSALFIHAVTASISRTHSQCQRRGRCPYRGEPRIRFSSSLENWKRSALLRSSSFGGQPSPLRYLRLACQPKLRSSEGWWSQPGSNRRPQACKASALPTELWPREARKFH